MTNESHIWFYLHEGMVGNNEEGPFDEKSFIELAKSGKISLTTKIRSPTRTKNAWITADKVSALAVKINEGKIEREKAKKDQAKQKAQQKADAKIKKAQDKADAKLQQVALQQQQQQQQLQAQQEAVARQAEIVQEPLATAKPSDLPFQQTIVVAEQQKTSGAGGKMAGLGALFAGSSMLIIVLLIVAVVVLPILMCIGCCFFSGMMGAGAAANLEAQQNAAGVAARELIQSKGLTNVVTQSNDIEFIGFSDEMVFVVDGYGKQNGDEIRWGVIYTDEGELVAWRIGAETVYEKPGYQDRVEDDLGW